MQKELSFSDRWMFNRVMCRENVCRQVLSAVLGIDVGRITYLNAEQVVEPTYSNRGIRMDVCAKDGTRVYDIEMQVSREADLGRRMRYYQAAIDTGELESGQPFRMLPDSYVVFLCCFDAYGKQDPAYHIERVCLECPDVEVGDGSPWVVLNATAWERAESEPLRDLLRYVLTGDVAGELSQEIDACVAECNEDRKWVSKVVTFEQDTQWRCQLAREQGLEQGLAQGIEQGIEQGEGRSFALVECLLEAGRQEDALRASHDAAYRDELFREFGL